MIDASVVRARFAAVGSGLNERSRRLHAAAEAKTAGYGGIAAAAPNNIAPASEVILPPSNAATTARP